MLQYQIAGYDKWQRELQLLIRTVIWLKRSQNTYRQNDPQRMSFISILMTLSHPIGLKPSPEPTPDYLAMNYYEKGHHRIGGISVFRKDIL